MYFWHMSIYILYLSYLRHNLWFCFIDTFPLDDIQDVHCYFTVILFRQDSKAILSCSFNKSAHHDRYVSDCYYKICPYNFGTAVLYLFVPLRTEGICETSASAAVHKTVRIAQTALYGELSILCNIQHGNWRIVKV